jgi:hypothetical protein
MLPNRQRWDNGLSIYVKDHLGWLLTPSSAAFAVGSRNATLVVFDLEPHQVITSLKIGGGPDSVAFDGTLHRIYSAGKAGRLTVIQQDDLNR